MAIAQAKIDDLRREADARRTADVRIRTARPGATKGDVTLRLGSVGDEKSLACLAALDSAEPLEQPVLLAEVDGQLLAALALSDGTVIADPFHRTAYLIDLLRARARQLDGHSPITRCGRLRSWARRCPPTRRAPIRQTTPTG
jgi:hypothetical protein